MSRTVTEYRVLSQRTGNAVTEKRYRSMGAVEKRIGLLTSAEPWRFYGKDYAARDPDAPMCCPGTAYYECGCGGVTLRQEAEARRKDLPPIEWVRVESRQITTTKWEPVGPVEAVEDPIRASLSPYDVGPFAEDDDAEE